VQYVVKLPDEGKYYQFGETEIELMRFMDGESSPAEIASRAGAALGVGITEGQAGDFAARLKRLGIVERTPAEQHVMLMERVRSQRRVRVRQRAKGSILRLRFSIGDPDRLFDAMVARTPWLWSRARGGASSGPARRTCTCCRGSPWRTWSWSGPSSS
jgi:hypothetical protein